MSEWYTYKDSPLAVNTARVLDAHEVFVAGAHWASAEGDREVFSSMVPL